MTAGRARTSAIGGSIGRAVALGHAIDARGHGPRPDTVAEALGARILIEGRVTDLGRNSATVDGTSADAGRQVRIELQSGFLIVLEDGVVTAAVPDIIVVLALDTGVPIASEALRRDDRVLVLAAHANRVWQTEAGLALTGPGAFGYGIEYASG